MGFPQTYVLGAACASTHARYSNSAPFGPLAVPLYTLYLKAEVPSIELVVSPLPNAPEGASITMGGMLLEDRTLLPMS
jgi:hypothetical protein